MIKPFKDISDKITYVTSSGDVKISAESILLHTTRSVSKKAGMISTIQAFSSYKQGINVKDSYDFFKSRLFKVSSVGFNLRNTEDLHRLSSKQYGMPKLFDDEGPYYDLTSKFSATSFISDRGTQTYPQSFFDSTLRFPDTMDGVIEPMPLRESITNTSTEVPYSLRSVKASIMGGNSNPADGSDSVFQYTERLIPKNTDPFIDGESVVLLGEGLGASGSNVNISGPGISSEIQRKLHPFKDSFTQYGTLYIFTGAMREENISTRFKKPATSGFEYRNLNGTGTDSIAFGGLQLKPTDSIRCDDGE